MYLRLYYYCNVYTGEKYRCVVERIRDDLSVVRCRVQRFGRDTLADVLFTFTVCSWGEHLCRFLPTTRLTPSLCGGHIYLQ